MDNSSLPANIVANSVLPAQRQPIRLHTQDGLTLIGELATPVDRPIAATMLCLHPLPTHGGMMDSHVFRKAAWRLPALAGIAVLRWNSRGTTSAAGTSEGQFSHGQGEGLDLAAALAWAVEQGLPNIWLVGWSFGTDLVLMHGDVDPVQGGILLSPPLRFSAPGDLQRWAASQRPLVCLIPEQDDYLRPAEARERFAAVAHAEVIAVPGAKHLWVGEASVSRVLQEVTSRLVPGTTLPTTWDGPMERWSDLP
jgi:uncharacterized protein